MRFILCFARGIAFATLATTAGSSTPLGTGFTYQGQLVLNGSPVNGTVQLRFSLWDAAGSGSPPVGGTHIGADQLVNNVLVGNGLFVVQLNDTGAFGVNAFNGDARWLQIEVCTDQACFTSTTLAPRQPVTATPYSRFAAGPWQLLGGNLYFNSGRVGIGTNAPSAPLSLGPSNGNSKLLLWDDGSPNGMGLGIGPNQYRLHLGLSANRFSFLDSPAGNEIFTILGTGNVGIGMTNPTQKLQVAGNIFLGPNGQYSAPAAEETVRLMRGEVNSNGSPQSGCCYSVTHQSTGSYLVSFTVPFSASPSIIVEAVTPGGGTFYRAATFSTSPNSFAVDVFDGTSPNPVDDGFKFLVMGPR